MHISASILSCDILNIESEINTLISAGIDYIHIDIMDGHLVPNIAFGFDIIKRISNSFPIAINVHLMIDNPEQFIDVVSHSNVNYVIVHTEGIHNIENTIIKLKSKKIAVGIAINPQTPIDKISKYLDIADLALIMGVYPGFGGQTLIQSTLSKVQQIKNIYPNLITALDGGVNESTIPQILEQNFDIVVIGSYLFEGCNQNEKLILMKNKINSLRNK